MASSSALYSDDARMNIYPYLLNIPTFIIKVQPSSKSSPPKLDKGPESFH